MFSMKIVPVVVFSVTPIPACPSIVTWLEPVVLLLICELLIPPVVTLSAPSFVTLASASSTSSTPSAKPAGTPVRLPHVPSKSSAAFISHPKKLLSVSMPDMSILKALPGAATVTSISSLPTSSVPAVATPSEAPSLTASKSRLRLSIACCTSFTFRGR